MSRVVPLAAVAVISIACGAGPDPEQAMTTTESGELAEAVEAMAAEWYGSGDIGGVVALISFGDGTVHVGALGDAAPGKPAGPDDLMRVGSITKTFTAALVLRLAEQDRLALDDDVAEHLPGLDIPAGISIEELLGHTSGITDPDTAVLIAEFRDDGAHRYAASELTEFANFTGAAGGPSEFVYANANYHLAGLVIEAVTGESYATALRTEILDPAALSNTYSIEFEPVPMPVVPGNVDLDGDKIEDSLVDIAYTAVDTYSWSAGAVVTTPADIVAFAEALFDGTLLGDNSIAKLQSGLGIVEFEAGWWGHNGGAPGYQAAFAHNSDHRFTAAVFTNCPTCASSPDTYELLSHLVSEADSQS